EQIVDKLAKIVGPEYVTEDKSRLDELSWDALSEGRLHPAKRPELTLPFCAVLPSLTAEVRRIVLLANEKKVPILPYGGGSGLMGGALSVRAGIVVDLRRMEQILDVDTQSRSARVQAGTVLEKLERRLTREGFMLGHDPWTLPVATVGGAISTNSMGYRGGLYGSMGEQVLGLEAVLPNGEVLRTRAVPKSSAGIDLRLLLVGGEGCFGIITEATMRIFPAPETRALHALRFEAFEVGYNAIQEMFRQRLEPAILDFGDSGEKFRGGAMLYLGFEGIREVVEAEEKRALTVCERFNAQELPRREAERFWNDRHEIARRFMRNRRQRRERGRDGIYRDWIHVALPASKVLPFREAAMAIAKKHGVEVLESGLWIQPELFSMPLGIQDDGTNRAQLALEEAVDALLGKVHEMGGSMEYTHGVGVKLAPLMVEEHGYGVEVMRQIKKTLDPNGIMNPGKMAL
ncbi:MAG TPA: FAD-binding oxidoreductase, partial [Candidatus Binatia bacterium]|nr:FAD-binding oxidoreductase [Candidatus Binatia bacterium]